MEAGQCLSFQLIPLIHINLTIQDFFNLPKHHPELWHGILGIERDCQTMYSKYSKLVTGARIWTFKTYFTELFDKISSFTGLPLAHMQALYSNQSLQLLAMDGLA